MLRDLRFAARALRKSPGVTLVAVLTLGLGVGVNTAVFSVIESVLLNRLPYRHAERLVALAQVDRGGQESGRVEAWIALELRTRSRAIDGLTLYDDAGLTLSDGGALEVMRGMRVTAAFFETLGVTPLLGRTFLPDDDRSPRANVLVLSHELWAGRFGGDPGIVGRPLSMNGSAYQVIGVLPRDFHPLRMSNPAETPRLFAPLGIDPRDPRGANRAIARLRAGVTPAQAQTEFDGIARQLARDFPSDYPPGATVRVAPLQEELVGPLRSALWIVFGAVGCVLLIACANVAGLQLARASARAREFAVRSALGGSRPRLVRQVLTENLLLAAAGGAAGLALGWLGTAAIVALAPPELPRLDEVHLDAGVLVFGLGSALLLGAVFGLAPALFASRVDVSDALKRGGGRQGSASGASLRQAVVVTEVALAFVLVIATGLLGRSVVKLLTVDAGFDPRHVLTLTPVMGDSKRPMLQRYRDIIDGVAAVPGVTGAGMTSNVPFSHTEAVRCLVEGAPSSGAREDVPAADVFWISAEYLRVMQVPLERGRFLDDHEGVDRPLAALVSASFARRRFGTLDVLGRRIRLGAPGDEGRWVTSWAVVVGIVGDVRHAALDRAPDEAVYLPQAANPFHYTRMVVRTTGDPSAAERAVRAAIRRADPGVAVFHVQPMDDYVAASMAQRRFALALIGMFGVLALLLAGIGLYALLAHSVVQRRGEIGIRTALGATGRNVMVLVLRRGLASAGAGLAAGLVLAFIVTRLLTSLLFEVRTFDLAAVAGAAVVLTAVAFFACYLPARRATRIDPLAAMRGE